MSRPLARPAHARPERGERHPDLPLRLGDPARPSLRLKVEISTREHFAVHGYIRRPYAVESRWFSGRAEVQTFELDELLATKLRALDQRKRGRDLFDLWEAARRASIAPARVVATCHAYLKAQGLSVTRAQFARNLAAKARDPRFLDEMGPLLAPGVTYDAQEALAVVRDRLLPHVDQPRARSSKRS